MVTNSISVPLKSMGEFRNGVNFSKEKKGKGLGLLNVKDIFSDIPIINYETLDKVDLAGEKGIENYFVQEGDLFFVRSSVKRDGVGLVSLAKTGSNQAIHCGFVIRFRITDENVHPRFLTYLLRSPHYREVIIGASGGAAITNISQSVLGSIEISLPPLDTQRKIAAVLSAYDDLIESNTRRIQILEEMAQAIYRQWFVEFQYPGHEAVPLVDSGTELGEIPQGWEVTKLSELVETQYGYTESAKEEPIGPKFVRGKDINKTSFIDWTDVPYCPIDDEKYEKYKLSVGDVVIIRMADPGKVGIIETNIDAVFASYLIRLKIVSDLLSPYFLFYTLIADHYQGYITGASTGTTRKSASAPVITDYKMVIPITKVRNEFETTISRLRRLVNTLLEKNANLRATRDLLLPRLVSGAVDVSELDIKTGG